MVYKTCLQDWIVLFLTLCLLAACTATPETQATIPVARSTTATPTFEAIASQPNPSPSPVPLPTDVLTATATATPTPSPGPTPISTQDVQATHTAIHATTEAEAATLFAPTPTFTPSPTFTPVPGPVWRIFFQGIPCSEGISTCDYTLAMDYSSMGYLINSDGSQLTPITDLGFPADFSQPVFSPDGTQLAYAARAEGDGLWHLFLANIDGSEAVDLGGDNVRDFQFAAEANCLIVARTISINSEGQNIVIEKRCISQLQPQTLDMVTFPGHYHYQFSSQGDALLAYGEGLIQETNLFVHEIGGNTNLIFSQTGGYFAGAISWLPSDPKIEFITGLFVPGHPITTTFNSIDPNGNRLEVRLDVIADFAITSGTWSPDGQQFAFTYGVNYGPVEESGLYILDLNTGEWRQILSHFYLGSSPSIYVWKQVPNGVSE